MTFKIDRWERLYTNWISNGTKIHLVQYEDILNPEVQPKVITSILEFLNFEASPERMQCIARHEEGKFHRKVKCTTKSEVGVAASSDYIHDIFTADQKKLVDAAIQRLQALIAERLPGQNENVDLDRYKSTIVDFC